MTGFCGHGNEPSGSINDEEFFLLSYRLLVPQERALLHGVNLAI
jgi:hypothetical protein